MLLSEAIREGAKKGRQCVGGYGDQPRGAVNTCAIGAASLVLSGDAYYGLPSEFTPFMHIKTTCPRCDDKYCFDVFGVILHLNDDHRWTRERIADWVETVEVSECLTSLEKTDEAVANLV